MSLKLEYESLDDKLNDALLRYEKATNWIDNATPDQVEKHYQNYLDVINDCRMLYNRVIDSIGFNPYRNYEELRRSWIK